MNFFAFSGILVCLTSLVLPTFVFLHNPRSKTNRPWLLFSLAVALWGGAGAMIGLAKDPDRAMLFWKIAHIGIISMPVLFLHFVYNFIDHPDKKRNITILYALTAILLALNLFTGIFFSGIRYLFDSFHYALGSRYYPYFVLYFCIVILYSHYELYKAYRKETGIRKKQIQYFFLATCIGFSGGITNFLPLLKIDIYPVLNINVCIYPVIMAYAIIRHHLMDITFIIKKTVTCSIILLILIVPSFLIVIVSDKYLPRNVYYPILIALFLVVGFVFPRIKVQTERDLEAILFRGGFDYKEALDKLSQKMARLHNLDELLEMSTKTIAKAFDTNTLGIYLQEDDHRFALHSCHSDLPDHCRKLDNDHDLIRCLRDSDDILHRNRKMKGGSSREKALLDRSLDDLGIKLCIPIKFEKELRGILVAAEKESAGDYSKEELKVLSTMANQLAVAIENSLKYEEINKLNTDLEGYVNEIEELNTGLEKKVEERTEELRKANEELMKLDKLKSEFISNVSHELRTPLTNIILPIQNILEEMGDRLHPDNVAEKQAMLRNANRLMKRINELLDFARLEAGKVSFRAGERSLNSILDDIVAASKIGADQMGIALRFIPDPSLPKVWVDDEKMEKILVNLIGNALKFTGRGGEVVITTVPGEMTAPEGTVPAVLCRVKDTGMGISAKELPHIFERFRQADSSPSRKYEGTGLGLFLVKEFVELHHGLIEVESEPGKGSEFTVKLRQGNDHFLPQDLAGNTEVAEPLREQLRQFHDRRQKDRRSGYDRRLGSREDQDTISFMQVQLSDLEYNPPETEESQTVQPVPDNNRKSVLIVEDNRDLAGNIGRCLSMHYNVHITYNGVEAMTRLARQLPDLIVSDVMMPEMDGYELCRQVKSGERTQHVPIILLTAKASLADKIDGLKFGADQYLAKPFNPRELLAVIESLLIRQELHARLNTALQQLKEAQSQLIQTARMETVGLLAAGLAHEVRNKMYCIRAGFEGIGQRLTMLRNGEIRIEDIYDRLIKVMDTNDKAMESSLNMVNILLGFSRQHNFGGGTMAAADLNQGIHDTLAIMVPMIRSKVQVETELTALPLVECNIEEINQTLMNLIINSYQAIQQHGTVRICTTRVEDRVLLTVSDDGPGIPAENLEKIFLPFFSTKPEGENSGLGLSICYSTIQAHHGDISVQSTPGQGTKFCISLPVEQPHAGAAGEMASPG